MPLSDAKREYMKRWRAANRERMRESERAWQLAHPERVKAHRRKTYENHRASRIDRVASYQATESGRAVMLRAKTRHNMAVAIGLRSAQVPEDLIDAKMLHIAILRALKEI